ncbi:MAG: HD-GYP domain-containing protein [Pseudomonadota bacterium]
MTSSIRRKVALRLVPAWLILSVVLGALTYWTESRRVDAFVFDLAIEAARHFNTPANAAMFHGDPEDHRQALREFIEQTDFVSLRLYSSEQGLLIEVWKKENRDLAAAAAAHRHAFPAAGDRHHNKIQVEGALYIQVLVPLISPERRIFGYLEGIYKLAPQTLEAVAHRVRDALLLVLLVVALTTSALYPVIMALNRDTLRLSAALLDSNVELMRTLGSAIAKRDSDTDAHNYRVTIYAVRLAQALGRPKDEIAALIAGAFLHDVGKIGIPDGILLKPGKLSAAEFDTIKTHVSIGEVILGESKWLEKARDVVAYHHEKYDGTGYLRGMKGDAIPFNARLFAIVDVFDALTSRRPYKPALPLDEVMRILTGGRGAHFDPRILDVFAPLAPRLLREYAAAEETCLRGCLAEFEKCYF